MRVTKKGRIVDIPIRQKTVVRERSGSSGTLGTKKSIVMGIAPATPFSRAYGPQAFICTIRGDYVHISERGASNLYPVGKVKRIPSRCKSALEEHKRRNWNEDAMRSRGIKRRSR